MSESDIPDFRDRVKEKWREGDIAECVENGLVSRRSDAEAPKKGQRFIVKDVTDGLLQGIGGKRFYSISLHFEGQPPSCGWFAGNFRKVGLEDTEEHIRRAAARHGLRTALDRVTRREKVEAV